MEDCKSKVDITPSFQTFACIDFHCYCLFATRVVIELLTIPCSSHFANLIRVKILNVLKREVLRRSDYTNFWFFFNEFQNHLRCYNLFVKFIVLAYLCFSLHNHISLLLSFQKSYPLSHMSITGDISVM